MYPVDVLRALLQYGTEQRDVAVDEVTPEPTYSPYLTPGLTYTPYPSPSPVSYTTPADEGNSPADKALALVIILLVIVAAILGMVLLTWAVSKFSDQWCGAVPMSQAAAHNAQFDHTPLARKARLWGLKLEERARILEGFFQKRIVVFQQRKQEQQQEDEQQQEKGKNAADGTATSDESEDATSTTEHTDNIEKEGDPAKDEVAEPIDDGSNVEEPNVEIAQPDHDVETGNAEANNDGKQEEETEDKDDATKLAEEVEALQDADHERICCICLNEYKTGDKLITGIQCVHNLHYACCMEWLNKAHDECPYCRKEMITASQFRKAALEVLGPKRVGEMGAGANYPAPTVAALPTTTPAPAQPVAPARPSTTITGSAVASNNPEDRSPPADDNRTDMGDLELGPVSAQTNE